jgi:hypothetical protein
MYTTLNAIRSHGPCGLKPNADGTRTGLCKLLHYLGKTTTDDEPLAILTILDSNGLDDALWCLRAVTGHDREIRLYAVWCARQVLHRMTDPRSIAALDVAERYANGLATPQELYAAGDAAWAAAGAAAGAAAWDAAGDAAWAAAGAAARAAAWDAARAAARDAQERELRRILAETSS